MINHIYSGGFMNSMANAFARRGQFEDQARKIIAGSTEEQGKKDFDPDVLIISLRESAHIGEFRIKARDYLLYDPSVVGMADVLQIARDNFLSRSDEEGVQLLFELLVFVQRSLPRIKEEKVVDFLNLQLRKKGASPKEIPEEWYK